MNTILISSITFSSDNCIENYVIKTAESKRLWKKDIITAV